MENSTGLFLLSHNPQIFTTSWNPFNNTFMILHSYTIQMSMCLHEWMLFRWRITYLFLTPWIFVLEKNIRMGLTLSSWYYHMIYKSKGLLKALKIAKIINHEKPTLNVSNVSSPLDQNDSIGQMCFPWAMGNIYKRDGDCSEVLVVNSNKLKLFEEDSLTWNSQVPNHRLYCNQ